MVCGVAVSNLLGSSAPTPHPLRCIEANSLGWGPERCIINKNLGDSDVHYNLKTTVIHHLIFSIILWRRYYYQSQNYMERILCELLPSFLVHTHKLLCIFTSFPCLCPVSNKEISLPSLIKTTSSLKGSFWSKLFPLPPVLWSINWRWWWRRQW